MSVGSFYILITKWLEQNRILKQHKAIRSQFWRANSLAEGASKLDKNSAWRQLVDDGLAAESQHTKMTDSLEAHDWLHGSLARSEDSINSRLAGGLPFLATVGATAPFVGLLGTVIGIIRAFHSLDESQGKITAGLMADIGEALVATAIGILVALPAVAAFNYFQRLIKARLARGSALGSHVISHLLSTRHAAQPEAAE
jgi:biopolymer transport protein ExbB